MARAATAGYVTVIEGDGTNGTSHSTRWFVQSTSAGRAKALAFLLSCRDSQRGFAFQWPFIS